MKKIYFILAVAATFTFSSCMNDEFVGDNPSTNKPTEEAITFGSGFQALTRGEVTGNTAAGLLNNEMKVYGVKSDGTSTTNFKKVFNDFIVRYSTDEKDNAEYNEGWYYVGAGASGSQTIRYWDYSSASYRFVAGSPVAKFNYTVNASTNNIETATVTGLGGRLNHGTTVASNTTAVYIADPVVMTKPTTGTYGEVMFTFRSMQSKVRVGIYETIPGYEITSISFYNNASTPVASNYITLNCATGNYFQGSSNVEGTITYNWATSPASYTFEYSNTDLSKAKYWEGGQFTSGVPATTSAATNLYGSDTSMGADGYFIVMPTPSATDAAPLTLKCDYVLKSLDDVDEIHVTGATATIPATYTKWEPNTAYTYLFKITDNTNGTTGSGSDPVGLYPITFDAAVVNVAEQNVGTETTVSTPSITIYQDGDVVGNGITYKAGSVTVKAYEGATDVTDDSNTTWSYVELASFNYASDYEHLGASGATTSWTTGKLTSVTANNTYVIKAVTSNGTAYFVLVVGAAENGPAN